MVFFPAPHVFSKLTNTGLLGVRIILLIMRVANCSSKPLQLVKTTFDELPINLM
jgi:hypothetical protein